MFEDNIIFVYIFSYGVMIIAMGVMIIAMGVMIIAMGVMIIAMGVMIMHMPFLPFYHFFTILPFFPSKNIPKYYLKF